MPRLSNNKRLITLGMIKSNISFTQVVCRFGYAKTVIRTLVNAKTRSTNDRPRPGMERVTTPEQERYIRLLHLGDRLRSASRTARETPGRHNQRISVDTVQRRLPQRDLRCQRLYRGAILKPVHRRRRLACTRQRVNWT